MSDDEIFKIMKCTPNKSCNLDPIPTFLVLDCISVLLTVITHIVNYSLQEGSFAYCFKTAHVAPLLQIKELSTSIQPLLHLQTDICIEKAVAKQITEHITHEGI